METTTITRAGMSRAWVVLAVALTLALFLWVSATRPTAREGDRVFGGGTGNVSRTEAHTNWVLVGVALGIAAAGLVGWAALLLEHRRNAARVTAVAGTAIAVAAVALWGVGERLRADDGSRGVGPRYASIAEVVDRLAGSRVECTRLTLRETSAPFFTDRRGACDIERRLALDDGLETVFIHLWRSSGSRADWYEKVPAADVVSVDGPTWLITCEFETTCSQIQLIAGGRTR